MTVQLHAVADYGNIEASSDDVSYPHNPPTRERGYRHTAQFVADWRLHCRPLDRNERARIIFLAEALELRTKEPGRRNGLLGQVGLQVLRCLAFAFLNVHTGLLCPAYREIEDKTGLCRQSVKNGLARLERSGIISIVRRIVRARINRISPITGEPEQYVGTVQTVSLYSIHRPGAHAEHLDRPPARNTPFPTKKDLGLHKLLSAAKAAAARRFQAESTQQEGNHPNNKNKQEERSEIGAVLANLMNPWAKKECVG